MDQFDRIYTPAVSVARKLTLSSHTDVKSLTDLCDRLCEADQKDALIPTDTTRYQRKTCSNRLTDRRAQTDCNMLISWLSLADPSGILQWDILRAGALTPLFTLFLMDLLCLSLVRRTTLIVPIFKVNCAICIMLLRTGQKVFTRWAFWG